MATRGNPDNDDVVHFCDEHLSENPWDYGTDYNPDVLCNVAAWNISYSSLWNRVTCEKCLELGKEILEDG